VANSDIEITKFPSVSEIKEAHTPLWDDLIDTLRAIGKREEALRERARFEALVQNEQDMFAKEKYHGKIAEQDRQISNLNQFMKDIGYVNPSTYEKDLKAVDEAIKKANKSYSKSLESHADEQLREIRRLEINETLRDTPDLFLDTVKKVNKRDQIQERKIWEIINGIEARKPSARDASSEAEEKFERVRKALLKFVESDEYLYLPHGVRQEQRRKIIADALEVAPKDVKEYKEKTEEPVEKEIEAKLTPAQKMEKIGEAAKRMKETIADKAKEFIEVKEKIAAIEEGITAVEKNNESIQGSSNRVKENMDSLKRMIIHLDPNAQKLIDENNNLDIKSASLQAQNEKILAKFMVKSLDGLVAKKKKLEKRRKLLNKFFVKNKKPIKQFLSLVIKEKENLREEEHKFEHEKRKLEVSKIAERRKTWFNKNAGKGKEKEVKTRKGDTVDKTTETILTPEVTKTSKKREKTKKKTGKGKETGKEVIELSWTTTPFIQIPELTETKGKTQITKEQEIREEERKNALKERLLYLDKIKKEEKSKKEKKEEEKVEVHKKEVVVPKRKEKIEDKDKGKVPVEVDYEEIGNKKKKKEKNKGEEKVSTKEVDGKKAISEVLAQIRADKVDEFAKLLRAKEKFRNRFKKKWIRKLLLVKKDNKILEKENYKKAKADFVALVNNSDSKSDLSVQLNQSLNRLKEKSFSIDKLLRLLRKPKVATGRLAIGIGLAAFGIATGGALPFALGAGAIAIGAIGRFVTVQAAWDKIHYRIGISKNKDAEHKIAAHIMHNSQSKRFAQDAEKLKEVSGEKIADSLLDYAHKLGKNRVMKNTFSALAGATAALFPALGVRISDMFGVESTTSTTKLGITDQSPGTTKTVPPGITSEQVYTVPKGGGIWHISEDIAEKQVPGFENLSKGDKNIVIDAIKDYIVDNPGKMGLEDSEIIPRPVSKGGPWLTEGADVNFVPKEHLQGIGKHIPKSILGKLGLTDKFNFTNGTLSQKTSELIGKVGKKTAALFGNTSIGTADTLGTDAAIGTKTVVGTSDTGGGNIRSFMKKVTSKVSKVITGPRTPIQPIGQ